MAATRGTKNPTRKIGLLSKNSEVHFEDEVWAYPTTHTSSNKADSTISIEKQFNKFLKPPKAKRKRIEPKSELISESEYNTYN